MDTLTSHYESVFTQVNNQLKSAYRKYKAFCYNNNFNIIRKFELSNFERNPKIFDENYDIEDFFKELTRILLDEKEFNKLTDYICDNIGVISFPKHMKDSSKKDNRIIRNFNIENFNADRLYYFIDLPITGHILGVLWILRCGYLLDSELSENCYANRLNHYLLENLTDNNSHYYVKHDCRDFTNHLFIPYFMNYQSWRDNALESIDNLLEDENDAIMISLDLKECYYRSLIDFKEIKKYLKNIKTSCSNIWQSHKSIEEMEFDLKIDERLTEFIERVFLSYSDRFNRKYTEKSANNKKIYANEYPMIPVGFLPSSIISNWNLHGLDHYIVKTVKPEYYGRYVDDILIVLKSSDVTKIEEKTFDELIDGYLTDNNYPKIRLFKKYDDSDNEIIYKIYNPGKNIKFKYHYEGLEIQESKLKTYIFSHEYSNTIIESFKNEIMENSFEFRLMQDSDSIKKYFNKNIFKINYKGSINKIRDIDNIEINQFEISKIIGRITWNFSDTSDDIDDDSINVLIDAVKCNIFNYMTLWDRLFTALLINNKYDHISDLVKYIQENIENITYTPTEGSSYTYGLKYGRDLDVVKNSLMKSLYSVLVRVFSLRYNSEVKKIIKEIESGFNMDIKTDFPRHISNCLYSSMQNTRLMKYPLQDLSYIFNDFDDRTTFDLINQENGYVKLYGGFCYPRFIKLNECILFNINNELFGEREEDYLECSFKIFQEKNFANDNNIYESYFNSLCGLKCMTDSNCPLIYSVLQSTDVNVVKINHEQKDVLKVGLLNTNPDLDDFERRLFKKPNLSSKRFDKLKNLINDAVKKNVDLLVMPEMYIPYEWVEKLVNISKDHQMAMIFGIEPIEHDNKMSKYIMMTLPFIYNDKYKECALMFRAKNSYSPEELMQFEKYGKEVYKRENPIYTMCIWRGIHIVPYFSYEIENITDRSIFDGCCDIVSVSEFSRDMQYTNNIIESLSRDLMAYVIKLNIAEYGGSCIIQPSQSNKYLVDLKGGADEFIVTCDLDIKKLGKSRYR